MTISEVAQFIGTMGSWLALEDQEEDRLSYTTRDNGDVYEETPGAADLQEARRVAKLVKNQFPGVSVAVDYVDEWTTLDVQVGEER